MRKTGNKQNKTKQTFAFVLVNKQTLASVYSLHNRPQISAQNKINTVAFTLVTNCMPRPDQNSDHFLDSAYYASLGLGLGGRPGLLLFAFGPLLVI